MNNKELTKKIEYQSALQLWLQLNNQLGAGQHEKKLSIPLKDQLDDQLSSQLWLQLWDQLDKEFE